MTGPFPALLMILPFYHPESPAFITFSLVPWLWHLWVPKALFVLINNEVSFQVNSQIDSRFNGRVSFIYHDLLLKNMDQEKTDLLKRSSRQQCHSELGIFALDNIPLLKQLLQFCSHPFTFSIYLQISSAAPSTCLVQWFLSLWHCSFFICEQQLKDAACPRDTMQNEAVL